MSLSMADGLDPLQSEEDVDEILRLAVRHTGTTGESLRQRLTATASELGISEEALEQAEKAWKSQKQSEADQALELRQWEEYRKVRIGDFVQHLGLYAVVNLFLYWIDSRDGHLTWFLWPVFGWGIAVAIHAISMVFPGEEERKDFQKWRRKSKRKN